MPNLYDLAYAAGLAAAAPYWLIKSSARKKVLTALRQRDGRNLPAADDNAGTMVMIHAVSVGEVNATPTLIAELRSARPDLHFVVSTTTQTGHERSQQLYPPGNGAGVSLIRFPLDFSGPIRRVLDAFRPGIVVLMELEVWPNFMRQCHKRGIPVIVANGRVTEPAMKRYRLAAPVTRRMFSRLAVAAVQDQTYARRFGSLGVPADRVQVLGTMKFDSAQLADRVEGDAEIAHAVGLRPGDEPIWLCGSTGPGEEQIALDVYRELLRSHPMLRLVIVPRHPPRFDEVAKLIEARGFGLVRRSAATLKPQTSGLPPAIILGDTMGELRKFYSLADVVFVGRSLVDLGPRQHGSDMIEPAALAKAVVVGPFTGNFDMAVRLLRAGGGVVEVTGTSELREAVHNLLIHPDRRIDLGRRAQEVVKAARGATGRHVRLILQHLADNTVPRNR